MRDAGADKRVIEAFEQRFEQLAGGKHHPDQDKLRQRQRANPDESLSFWHHQGNGLAVLAIPEMLRIFRLAETPKPLAEVADRLHLTPLLRAMASRHDAFVLGLAEESARLVHVFANFPALRVPVPELPKNVEEATHRPSFHVRAPRGRLQNLEGEKVLLHQYVEQVDRAVRDALRGHTAPLILAAAEPLASMFRAVCDYPELAEEVLEGNPDRFTDAEIEDRAIPILDRFTAREVTDLIARYEELKPRRATTDVSYAAHAATQVRSTGCLWTSMLSCLGSSAISTEVSPMPLRMMRTFTVSSTRWRGGRYAPGQECWPHRESKCRSARH